ncbi:methylated-DNA--[protein]-cysteine S-methyltransferase [Pararobbsia silviterrae]|uniref:Methylated-DNA--protein-cysteine methyltransferase n=1 Tax=Pararobbsia silviterrae TaxID=1792498 RepID=A0A494XM73_9BURK|nr:methylated-DNA--[protein]-cysteine S-methyltransferase [Pararobbsia silviterrae]RKP51787.1 methylated-DNA--[protein]-cysteine S-methyltransferase [Pararobbsia silviterrae]
MTEFDTMPSPLGEMLIASDGEALSGLWFLNQKYSPTLDGWRRAPTHAVIRATHEQIDAYFHGDLAAFTVPLAPRGTPFQEHVWRALLTIDYGVLTTYGDIALRVGLPKAKARAVGGAVGRNPISIIVPCHRVIGQSGSLTGYAGGLDRKRALLALEKQGAASRRPEFALTGEA